MSKNRRDQILNMAFGERETEGVLYESLSEEERVELETLRKMREGLLSLHEVPECQLSPERLRGAILSNAVKKRPTHLWSYASSTAAFVAVAVIAFSAGVFDSIIPEVVQSNGTENPLADFTSPIDVTNDSSSVNGSSGDSENNDDPGLTIGVQPNPEVDSEPTRTNGGSRAGVNDWKYELNVNRSPDYVLFTSAFYFPADDVEVVLQPVSSEVSGPLVVVSNSIEDISGAFEATEVETFGDVVFGG